MSARSSCARSMQGKVDQAMLDSNEVRTAVINGLVDKRALLAHAMHAGVAVTDEQVRKIVTGISAFRDESTGKFSPERYEQLLRSQGMSPVMFEERVRQDLRMSQVRDTVANSALVSDAGRGSAGTHSRAAARSEPVAADARSGARAGEGHGRGREAVLRSAQERVPRARAGARRIPGALPGQRREGHRDLAAGSHGLVREAPAAVREGGGAQGEPHPDHRGQGRQARGQGGRAPQGRGAHGGGAQGTRTPSASSRRSTRRIRDRRAAVAISASSRAASWSSPSTMRCSR